MTYTPEHLIALIKWYYIMQILKKLSVYEVKVEQTCPWHVMTTTLGTSIEILE